MEQCLFQHMIAFFEEVTVKTALKGTPQLHHFLIHQTSSWKGICYGSH